MEGNWFSNYFCLVVQGNHPHIYADFSLGVQTYVDVDMDRETD